MTDRATWWLLVVPILAGCIAGPTAQDAPDPGDPIEPGWAERALNASDEHDHSDPLHHDHMTTPNFEVVGHDPIVSDDYGTTPPGNLCGDANRTEDGRTLAAVESRGDVAFTLVDVTRPDDPIRLGELVMRTTYVYDLAVVPDGDHLALITSTPKEPDNGPTEETGLAWRSGCTGGETVPVQDETVAEWAPHSPMVLLVDISDPSRPVIVDRHPAAGAGHSIHATRADGRTWVLASSVGLLTANSVFQFFQLTGTPDGDRMEPLSVYDHAVHDPEEADRAVGHTDGWIQVHPDTGQTLAYLVAWDSGLIIVDVTDPRTPEPLGQWSDHEPGTGDATGNVHSAHPIDGLWDGRHYTLIGPEMGSKPTDDRATGLVYLIDTTDPAEPEAVGGWTLPHDLTWDGRLQFSNHYLTVQGRTGFVSMYHAGVWAIDLGNVTPGEWTRLPSRGVFTPVEPDRSHYPDDEVRWTPTLEEVHAIGDDTLLTFDSNTGAWTFRYDEQMTLPAVEPTVEISAPGG